MVCQHHIDDLHRVNADLFRDSIISVVCDDAVSIIVKYKVPLLVHDKKSADSQFPGSPCSLLQAQDLGCDIKGCGRTLAGCNQRKLACNIFVDIPVVSRQNGRNALLRFPSSGRKLPLKTLFDILRKQFFRRLSLCITDDISLSGQSSRSGSSEDRFLRLAVRLCLSAVVRSLISVPVQLLRRFLSRFIILFGRWLFRFFKAFFRSVSCRLFRSRLHCLFLCFFLLLTCLFRHSFL